MEGNGGVGWCCESPGAKKGRIDAHMRRSHMIGRLSGERLARADSQKMTVETACRSKNACPDWRQKHGAMLLFSGHR